MNKQWRRHVGNGWVRTPHFCSDPSWDLRKSVEKCFLYRGGGGGGVPCMYIVTFYCSPATKNCSDPHFFWAGYATVNKSLLLLYTSVFLSIIIIYYYYSFVFSIHPQPVRLLNSLLFDMSHRLVCRNILFQYNSEINLLNFYQLN